MSDGALDDEPRKDGLTAIEKQDAWQRVGFAAAVTVGAIWAIASGWWSDRLNLWVWIAAIVLVAIIVGAHSIGTLWRDHRRSKAQDTPLLRWRIRLAIVATLLWLGVGTVFFVALQLQERGRIAALAFDSCNRSNQLRIEQIARDGRSVTPVEDCFPKYDEAIDRFNQSYVWRDTFGAILGAASLFWLLGIIFYLAIAWIWAGRLPRKPKL